MHRCCKYNLRINKCNTDANKDFREVFSSCQAIASLSKFLLSFLTNVIGTNSSLGAPM